jgi:hypothetical protein
MRHPRLEAVFGARLDQLAFDHIKAIVGNEAAAEDTDLDYKKIIHANDAKTIAEFCKDLAAMANGRGGVLIVGVEEDSRSVPSVITGVDIRDAEIRRLRLTTAGRIFPHLDFEIRAAYPSGGQIGEDGVELDGLAYVHDGGGAVEAVSAFVDRAARAVNDLVDVTCGEELGLRIEAPWPVRVTLMGLSGRPLCGRRGAARIV